MMYSDHAFRAVDAIAYNKLLMKIRTALPTNLGSLYRFPSTDKIIFGLLAFIGADQALVFIVPHYGLPTPSKAFVTWK